jgi:hypothetical protein
MFLYALVLPQSNHQLEETATKAVGEIGDSVGIILSSGTGTGGTAGAAR